MRIKHAALILTAGFLLIPTLTWSQGPGGFGGGRPGGGGGWNGGQWGGGTPGGFPGQFGGAAPGGGDRGFAGAPGGGAPGGGWGGSGVGGGGMGRMQMDPDQLFKMLSGGKDVINVNEMNPMFKGMFDRMGPRL